MVKTLRISPVNSTLFLSGQTGAAIPEFEPEKLVLSTPSCISFHCLMEQDGQTEIVIGATEQVDPGVAPNFDGVLETPEQMVVLSTVEAPQVLAERVASGNTRVRIWANRLAEPDHVIIGLG